jgi:hypothetical protein
MWSSTPGLSRTVRSLNRERKEEEEEEEEEEEQECGGRVAAI